MEAHIRDNSYAMTFDATLGRAKDAKAANREREAKRLAFYIFWNCKSEFMRYIWELCNTILKKI